MNVIETVEYKGYTIQIVPDEDAESPREWSNFGHLVLSHKRYALPHECDINEDDYSCWEDLEKALKKDYDATLILKVWGYDHSGLFLKAGTRTYPFNDVWDSGMLGFIFVTHADMIKEYGYNNRYSRATATEVLIGEVDAYNAWGSGEVYYYTVEDQEGEVTDSCGGYYDSNDAIADAKAIIEYHLLQQEQCDNFVSSSFAL